VPQILAGNAPEASSLHTQVASNSFDRPPVAIVVGGGYDDEAYSKLRDLSIEACGARSALGVAFFRADNALTERLFAEGKGPEKRTAAYPQAITKRLKAKLTEVVVGDGLKAEEVGELFWY
jgi:hypothetical protein